MLNHIDMTFLRCFSFIYPTTTCGRKMLLHVNNSTLWRHVWQWEYFLPWPCTVLQINAHIEYRSIVFFVYRYFYLQNIGTAQVILDFVPRLWIQFLPKWDCWLIDLENDAKVILCPLISKSHVHMHVPLYLSILVVRRKSGYGTYVRR